MLHENFDLAVVYPLSISRDAWIPTEQTRTTLVTMVTSPPGTFFPDPGQMTMPGVVVDEPQV